MPTFHPDTLHAILIIRAGVFGLFAGAWLFGYFFSSGEDTDESFEEAAKFRGDLSWGGIKIWGLVILSVVAGVIAYHGMDALVQWLSANK